MLVTILKWGVASMIAWLAVIWTYTDTWQE